MKDLSLHVLDIAENSVRAEATLVEITVIEDEKEDLLVLEIKDDGRGMDDETLKRATDPFFTTKGGKRVGLGLAMLAQAAREAEGSCEVSSAPHVGTKIRAMFRYSHPDRKPLGDIPATLQTLVMTGGEVDIVYRHNRGAEAMEFDTRKAKSHERD